MSQIASTMPEAKFRSTKKQAKPASSLRSSEFAHERRSTPRVAAALPAAKSASAERENEKQAKKATKKASFSIVSFWPVAVGFFLSGFAAEWHDMAAQIGVWGMRFAFPLSLIATHRTLLGLDDQMAAALPGIALYGQLPLDGLLLTLTFAQTRSLKSAVIQVTLVHAVCAFVLWLITM